MHYSKSLFVTSNVSRARVRQAQNQENEVYRISSPTLGTRTYIPLRRIRTKSSDTIKLLFLSAAVLRKRIHCLLAVPSDLHTYSRNRKSCRETLRVYERNDSYSV